MTKALHVWLPGVEQEGGIQVYSRFLYRALHERGLNLIISTFLKNDRSVAGNGSRSHVFGNWHESLRAIPFAASVISNAYLDRPSSILVGHANFAIIASYIKDVLGIPYSAIVYGIEAWGENGIRVGPYLRSADRVIAISSYTRDRIISELRVDPERVVLLPTTMDGSRFQIRPKPADLLARLNLQPEHSILLTVCRLGADERYKGYDQIIRALPAVLKEVPQARYILAGRGGDEPRIRQLIAQLGLEKIVILPGFVPENELPGYYNLCDVFAMPSRQEGFGIVYLEALASGKPVMAGDSDGGRDALHNGELGVLVDPENIQEIACTLSLMLQRLHSHPLIYKPEELRAKALAYFGFDQFSQSLQKIVDLL